MPALNAHPTSLQKKEKNKSKNPRKKKENQQQQTKEGWRSSTSSET